MTEAIRQWYEFALQQMAAETYLDRFIDEGRALEVVLADGNTDTRRAPEPSGYTRMPAAQAAEFIAKNQIIAHRANDSTGFSGTLLRWTNEQGGTEYTLSIRSTEYKNFIQGGDAERDNLLGANGEIITRGFALGQLAALEDFYEREVLPLTGAAKINVTGYSLGGHLATVFTETHTDLVKAAYVYNGAGRGILLGEVGTTAERMSGMIGHFRAALTSEPNASAFAGIPADDPRRTRYQLLYQAALQAHLGDPGWNPFAAGDAIAYDDPRYRWALVETGELAGYRTMPGAPFRAGLGTAGDALITSIYGSALNTDSTLVANSQIHPSNKNALFIEGQPFLELSSSSQERSDFGNTHAITLLADSLALQREFQRLDPTLTRVQIEALIKASSANKAKITAVLGDSQAAEGDSLEKTLLALRRAFDGNAVEVQSDATPGGFGNMANRQSYFEQLAALPQQGTYRIEVLAGNPSDQVAGLARRDDDTGLAVRYALRQLEPFAVVGADYSSVRFPEGELELRSASSERGMTDEWIEARAKFLDALSRFNTANGDLSPRAIGGHFEDRQRDLRFGSTIAGLPRYIFGADSAGLPLIGAGAGDFLIGGTADDTITAVGGNDYMEGGGGVDVINAGSGEDEIRGDAGSDELYGGDDDDRLYGGLDSDRLEGGKGNDRLEGGGGFDSYVYSADDGHDTILDSDGSGKITYKGRELSGGAQTGLHSFTDDFGTRYVLAGGAGGRQTLVIDGAISVENFISGNLGIILPGASAEPPMPPEVVSTRDYTLSYPYPADQPPMPRDGDIISYFRSALVNIYGSDENDLFSNTYSDIWVDGVHGRAGDDVVEIAGPIGNFPVDGGSGNDFIDASASSLLVGPFVLPVTLAGGSGDDYILGGADGDGIWGDNYRFQNWFRVRPGSSGPSGAYLIDNFIFNLKDAFPDRLLNESAATLATLANAGAYFYEFGPYTGSSTERFPESLFLGNASDFLLPYLELEGWLFPGGLTSALNYVLGVDPTFDDFIDGGAGDDAINGGSGSDTIYGGSGNDVIDGDANVSVAILGPLAAHFGAPGDDIIDGGDGNDKIFDLAGGNDTLIGGAGNDVIRSEEQAWSQNPDKAAFNDIDGGDGDDTIVVINTTEGGYDLVEGGAGNDVIGIVSLGSGFVLGGEGNDSIGIDTLVTAPSFDPSETRIGTGEFYVDGGAGDDLYGAVNGTIHDSDGDDTILVRLPSPTDVTESFLSSWSRGFQPPALTEKVYREDDDLVVLQKSNYFGRELVRHTRVADWFVGPTSPIEHVRFVESPGNSEPLALESWGGNYVGTSADEVFVGAQNSDRVLAGDGIDQISTEAGDDLISGGKGDDFLDGGTGDDKYFYAVGHGNDIIDDESGFDVLHFGVGADLSSLSVELGASNTFLHVAGGTLELIRSNTDVAGDLPIDRLVFADGTTVALIDFLDTAVAVTGTESNDTLVGNNAANAIHSGAGNDLLFGGEGDDTYLFALGDGVDRISDSPSFGEVNIVEFGPGITPEMLTLGSGSLSIRVGSNGDAIHLENVDTNDIFGAHDVDLFKFSDGAQLTYNQLIARGLDLFGTSSSDVIVGSNTTDRVFGNAGDDLLVDGAGDDTYFFGRGDGADTIVESDVTPENIDMLYLAADILASDVSIATSGDDIVIQIGNTQNSVTVQGALLYDVIERVQFGDGAVWSAGTLRERAAPPPNRSPVTEDDTAAVEEDITLVAGGNVLVNDTDLDLGDTLSVANPGTYVGAFGTLALAVDGSYSYALDNVLAQSLAEGQEFYEVFSYEASDGIASALGSLVVVVNGTNDAPVLLTPISDQNAAAGAAFSFAFAADTFDEPDFGDTLAYSASLADGAALPSWLSFDAATRSFSGTPPDGTGGDGGGADDCGCGTDDGSAPETLQLRVTATDTTGASAADVFILSIAGGSSGGGFVPIVGTDQDDVISGTSGNDVIDGRTGYDKMSGGASDDVYFVDKTGRRVDLVIEGSVAGYDTVYSSASYTLPANVEELHLIGREDLEGRGNALANMVIGNSGDNRLYGMAGNDLLLDDAGDDLLDGGDGDDVLDGGAGNDRLIGGKGNDLFVHTKGGGHDLVQDSGGQDAIRFGAGIATGDVTVRRADNDLVLRLSGGKGSVTAKEWFASSSKRIEQVQFADGTVWNDSGIRSRVTSGSGGELGGYCGEGGHSSYGSGNHGSGHDDDRDNHRNDHHGRHDSDDERGRLFDAIAARLKRSPDYDFTALAVYLQRQGGGGYGAMTPEQIARRWVQVQNCVGSLAQSDDDWGGGHGGDGHQRGYGSDDDHRRGGWGYSGSTGQSGGCGGMGTFSGLGEGFQKL